MGRNIFNITWMCGFLLWWMGCPSPPLQHCTEQKECGDSASCIEGRCVPHKECLTDLSCTWPQSQCVDGHCVPNTACVQTQDCSVGQSCVQGRCVYEPKPEAAAVLFLAFEDGDSSVSVKDSSPQPHKVTWKGQGQTVAQGYMGKAASFDGTDRYLEISPSVALKQPALTVSLWLYPLEYRDATLFRYCDAACQGGWLLTMDAQGVAGVQVGNGKTTQTCRLPTALPLQQWTHLAASYDGKTLRCFGNGILLSSQTGVGAVTYPDGAAWIGGQPNSNKTFKGYLDEITIWPWAREHHFLPGWRRYLYVSSADQQILTLDAERDEMVPNARFSVGGSFRPVGVSPDGKFLLVWDAAQSKWAMVDVSSRQIMFSVSAPGAGWTDGAKISIETSTSTLWLWGDTTYVYRWPPTADTKPLAVFSGLGKIHGAGIAWDAKQRKFLISDTENRQIRQISATSLQALPAFVLNDPKLQNMRPGAVVVNPTNQNLYVAASDMSLLSLFVPEGNSYLSLGQFAIVDTSPDVTTNRERVVERMVAHLSGLYMIYTFTQPSYLYRLDIRDKVQHAIRGKDTGSPVPRFSSSYGMYVHPQGDKMYVQDANSGVFYIFDVEKRRLLRSVSLGQKTAPGQWPLAGSTHPAQP